jgi:hypothetical protein
MLRQRIRLHYEFWQHYSRPSRSQYARRGPTVGGLRSFMFPLAAALLLGVATGVAAYCAGPWLAGLVGGAGSLSLRLALSVRRLLWQVWNSPVLARVRAALRGLGRWGVV